jgi:hypothetical protein
MRNSTSWRRCCRHGWKNSRHDAQFWPQFNALAQQILQHAEADDRPHVLQRLDAMLKEYDDGAMDGRPNVRYWPIANTNLHLTDRARTE